jgi:CheY-like chemotaxis protein
MPDMDGFTLTAAIRNAPTIAGTTVALLTSAGPLPRIGRLGLPAQTDQTIGTAERHPDRYARADR